MGAHLLLMGGMRSPPVPLAAPACWIVADVVLSSAAAATGDEGGGRRPLLSPPSSSSCPSAAWLGVGRPDLASLIRHHATASHRASARPAAVGSAHLAVQICPLIVATALPVAISRYRRTPLIVGRRRCLLAGQI
ncbi:hypothetical protein ACLOJK_007654 [Asimina triloba]